MSTDTRRETTGSLTCEQEDSQRAVRNKLLERLRELEEHHKQELDAIHLSQTQHDEVLDRGEEAAADADRELLMAIDAHWVDELTQVKAALQRIDSGLYGVCEACGNEIEPARQQANPSASRCIQCQETHEAKISS